MVNIRIKYLTAQSAIVYHLKNTMGIIFKNVQSIIWFSSYSFQEFKQYILKS